ncbi:hypothetical protein [Vulcanococcus limneticus]|uniref:hypothetical protein n=1 Tax=Vulcanococcus limneticus TaxID=2170428 RepID=UPI00398BC0F9
MAEAAPATAESGGASPWIARYRRFPSHSPFLRARADPLDSAPVPEGLRRAEAD